MRSYQCVALTAAVLVTGALPQPAARAEEPLAPQFGQPSDRIGTFDGRVFWFGWNASFSETYEPVSETYNWVIYIAPEAVYLALQSAESLYSGVDVNAGIGKFFGTLISPQGDTVSWDYVTSLSGVTLSKGISFNAAPVGPLSGLSIGYGVGVTMFQANDVLQRGIQLNATAAATFELISVPLPVSVSLDRKSNLTGDDTGFWPILVWDAEPDGARSLQTLTDNLQRIASRAGDAHADTHAAEIARLIVDFLSRVADGDGAAVPDESAPGAPVDLGDLLDEFLAHDDASPRTSAPAGSFDRLLVEAQEWLDSGDTSDLSDALRAWDVLDEPEVYVDLQRLQAATGLSFELGYRRGYDATGRDDTVYADAIQRVHCPFGESCTITVTAKEVAKVLSVKTKVKPGDLEGVRVWFDHSPDAYLSAGSTSVGVPIENGKASYTFTQSSNAPFLMGVEVPRTGATENIRIVLSDRLVLCDALRVSISQDALQRRRARTLKVQVRDTDGKKVPDFTVDVTGCGLDETTAAARGRAVLKKLTPTSGGAIRIRVRADGYDDCVRTVPVRDLVSVKAGPRRIKLGKLKAGKGKKVTVRVKDVERGKLAGAEVRLSGCGVELAATTDAKGRAVFDAVEPTRTGTMVVVVTTAGAEADVRPVIAVVP